MTEERLPWWYSGSADAVDDDSAAASEEAPSGLDWGALIGGAQRMIDWATERVMAPHADHVDPADHPDCVVCRTILLVGERRDDRPKPERHDAPTITWIPIRGPQTPD